MYQGENIKERGKIFIKLLLPVLIYQVISYSSGMIGTFMAGHYSPTDLAGVSMGVNIWNPVMYTLNAIVLAIVPIVSHLIGKKREEEIPVMVRQFLYIAVLISIILVIALNTLAAPIVDSLGMDAKIATITKNYLYYESFGVLSIFLYVVLRSFMDSLGLTRLSMIMMIISVPVNVTLAYGFIFGKFGMPELGGAGNAIAVSLTYTVLFFIALFLTLKHPKINKYKIFKKEGIRFKYWGEIFKLGIPIAIATALETVVFSTLSLMVSRFDTTIIASHQAALNFSGFLYSLPVSVANTATIIVAYHVGAKNYKLAKSYTALSVALGVISSGVAGLIVLLFDTQIPYLYSTDSGVIDLTAHLLIFAIGFALCDSFASALAGVLRGYKKVVPICLAMFVGYYIVGIPVAYYLVFTKGVGIDGLWIGWIIGLAVYALGVLGYYLNLSRGISKKLNTAK
ncbi:MATE family efflux transporter [Gemella sanguinis]|uniref:Probable multidrug resistance protein NorM n=3 Tax=Gemella sanguinis TaxID=84135 RepID=A0A2N6SHB8_9BACL|nr:MATE family efflux transporter [Gemella sanguinis]PMC53327.1 MATE family efflux transporter [Gemella sanguinis]QGS08334.1 MATE family efflux transporter [Gemella sanguinis]